MLADVSCGNDDSRLVAPPCHAPADAVLAAQRSSADELLEALEELQENYSLLDESATAGGLPPPPPLLACVAANSATPLRAVAPLRPLKPTPAPSSVMSCLPHQHAAAIGRALEIPQAAAKPTAVSHTSAPRLAASLQQHVQPASPNPPNAALLQIPPAHNPPPTRSSPRPPTEMAMPVPITTGHPTSPASTSRMPTSSHRMAAAAAAALGARETEAAKLKGCAEQLLRERSDLVLDLEGLRDTFGRMVRAVQRARDQALAMRTESAKYAAPREHRASLSCSVSAYPHGWAALCLCAGVDTAHRTFDGSQHA